MKGIVMTNRGPVAEDAWQFVQEGRQLAKRIADEARALPTLEQREQLIGQRVLELFEGLSEINEWFAPTWAKWMGQQVRRELLQ